MRRPVDHLVVAAQDLDAIVATYRRLGFLVGGRNRHPWGTENHIVQLGGAFLELIGMAPDFRPLGSRDDAAPFANTLARFIQRREGLALVSLQSRDAIEDARHFAALGIGLGRTLHFSRSAETLDGTRKDVAFTTAFALDPDVPTPAFFVCQHHYPEIFWDPARQRHPNGARSLLGVVMVTPEPRQRLSFLRDLFGEAYVGESETGVSVDAGTQTIELLPPNRFQALFETTTDEGFAAYRIGVETLEPLRRFLNVSGTPYTIRGPRLIVSASVAHGVTMSFEIPAQAFEVAEDRRADPS